MLDHILIELWILGELRGGAFDTHFYLEEDKGGLLGPL